MSDGTSDVMPLASITSRLPIWVQGEFFWLLKVWCYPKTPFSPSVENKVKKALPFVPSVVKLSLNFSTLQPFQWVVYSVAISPLAGSLKNLILDVPFSLAISGLKSSSYLQLPFQPLKTKCHKNHQKKKLIFWQDRRSMVGLASETKQVNCPSWSCAVKMSF